MNTRCMLSAVALAIAGLSIAATSPGLGSRTPDEHGRALITLTGRDAASAEPEWNLARSQAEFAECWTRTLGEATPRAAQGWPLAPMIDFDRCDAVVIAGGPGFNANGYRVMDVRDDPDTVSIYFERDSFQTASFGEGDGRVPANPWALIVIPRTDKPIVLLENVQPLIAGEPIWQERATFPAR